MKACLMLTVLLIATTVSASSGEPLRLAVSPAFAFAPANLNVRARVTPNADNRSLTIVAESGEFYRSSEVQLDGEQTPALITFDFRSLPDGEYTVSGTLVDASGHRRAVSQHQVTIMPGAYR